MKPFDSVAVWESGLVTVTFTAPSALLLEEGVVAFRLVLLWKVTLVALFCPKDTVAPERKFVPVIVTTVPPAGQPIAGEIFVTVGTGYWYVKPFGRVAICVSGLVTDMLTGPSALFVDAGAVALRLVLLTKVTAVALFCLKATVAPDTKLVPVIVTTVPPVGVPTAGEIFVIVGAGAASAGESTDINNSEAASATARVPFWKNRNADEQSFFEFRIFIATVLFKTQ